MEDFEYSVIVTEVRKKLEVYLVQLCSFFSEFGYMARWNLYINDKYQYTTTYNTYTTLTTQTTPIKNSPFIKKELHFLEIFNKIWETNINGRNLELMMPLFLIADFISPEIFEKILIIAKKTTEDKKDSEMMESRDVMLIDFISQMGIDRDFKSIKTFTNEFRGFAGDEEGDEKWINSRWIGRALKRLSLVLDKRRMKDGMEIIVDVQKAIEKIKIFRNEVKNE